MTLPLIKRTIRGIFDKTGVSGRLELALFVFTIGCWPRQPQPSSRNAADAPDRRCRRRSRCLAVEKTFYPATKPVLLLAPAQIRSHPAGTILGTTLPPPKCGK